MSNKELIKNILNDISMKVYVGKNLTTSYSSGGMNRVLVLFNGSDVASDKILAGLKDLKSQGCIMKLAFSKEAEHLLCVDDIVSALDPFKVYLESEGYNGHDIAKGTDMAIAPNITQNTLAKLAVGIQDSMVSNILWMLLLEGVKVTLNTQSVFEGAQPLSKNPMMRQVFESHIEKVVAYGAEIVEEYRYTRTQTFDIETAPVQVKEATAPQKLVNEQAILDLKSDVKELVLQKGQIITPAAKDLANARRISIKRG